MTHRLAAVVLATVVLGAGCSGGDAKKTTAVGPTTTTTGVTTTAPPTTIMSAAGSTTSAPVSTTTSASSKATTTTAAPPAAVRSLPSPGLTFTAPGTYRYSTTGRFTSALGTQDRSGQATLTVNPPAGTDQRSILQGVGRTEEQLLRSEGGNALVVSLRITDQGIDKEVRPTPPALALPGDAIPGRSWSWESKSTDGLTTVASAFRVLRFEDITVGAERVPTLVVEVAVMLSGDVTSTSKQTLWISRAHRLIVRQDDATEGRFGLFTFSTASTDTLLSLTPG